MPTSSVGVDPLPPKTSLITPGEPTDDETFLSWIFAEAGLSARHYRPNALHRRLPACLRALRVPDITHARRVLRRNPNLIQTAIDALLLGVTEFFRDAAVFDCLGRELSNLTAKVPGTLRVWSAACSDGAELYSIAMLLAERDALPRCELLGTDCRPDAITRASSGIFGTHALRGLSPERIDRFFEKSASESNGEAETDPRYAPPRRINESLRQRMTWRYGDAIQAAEPGPWDVLLCRNMAMYLQPGTAERLWEQLTSSLAPGGLLVLGKAERPTGIATADLTAVGPCVYRRNGERP